jgi:hypothetical protein
MRRLWFLLARFDSTDHIRLGCNLDLCLKNIHRLYRNHNDWRDLNRKDFVGLFVLAFALAAFFPAGGRGRGGGLDDQRRVRDGELLH